MKVEDTIEAIRTLAYAFIAFTAIILIFGVFKDLKLIFIVGGVILLMFYGAANVAKEKRLRKEKKELKLVHAKMLEEHTRKLRR